MPPRDGTSDEAAGKATNRADTPRSGARNTITDVPGIRVGHTTRRDGGRLTGVTVVLPTEADEVSGDTTSVEGTSADVDRSDETPGSLGTIGAVGAMDVRGGGPGTRESDALDPRNLVPRIHAVVLTGGSAYGLATADGVMTWLERHRAGYRVGEFPEHVVPIVPAAAIFDLGRGGSFLARPTAVDGYDAIEAAAASPLGAPVAQGCVGAGTGAVAGGLKGGVGTASELFDTPMGTITVGALVVVNAAGSAVDPHDGTLYGARFGLPGEFDDLPAASPDKRHVAAPDVEPRPHLNTTIGVIATDAVLDRAEAAKIAGLAHDGLARAINPVHTLFDGDTLFALSTGRIELPDAGAAGYPHRLAHAHLLTRIGVAAADCVTRAVCHALLAADSVHTEAGDWLSYRDTRAS
jgi:putative pantetheine hydrolase